MDEPEQPPERHSSTVAGVAMQWWVSGQTFHCTFTAPRMLRLRPDYEAMVLDQCVQTAYGETMMPVGEVYWSDEDIEDSAAPGLKEGERMQIMSSAIFGSPKMMRVTMEVMV